MAKVSELLGGRERDTVQLHWGGGTPTFLPPAEMAELMAMIRKNFRLSEDLEFGVEVDPRMCTEEQLDALAAGGVNRLSMGVQDIDPTVQQAVNRVQPVEETWRILDGAHRRGMDSVNIDLIYGLPHQTPESFDATVAEVIRMSPDRIAVFNFAYLPEMFAHQRTIDPEALPDPETKLTILENTANQLTAAGYAFIGMDHFAKPEDPLTRALEDGTLTRNFQGYSTCGRTDLVAFGVSSISHVAGGFAQNVKGLDDYQAALGEDRLPVFRGLFPTPEDRLRRAVIMGIMSHFRLDKDAIERHFGIDFDRHFADALEKLEPLAADGLVEIGDRRLQVTPVRPAAGAQRGHVLRRLPGQALRRQGALLAHRLTRPAPPTTTRERSMAVDSIQTPRRPTERSDGPRAAAATGHKTVLLVGNPNVGKSVLFRNLTQRYVIVSNFPGTTVEIARARATFNGRDVEVVDTPGINDISPRAEDARVTREMIDQNPDATIVQVADAKNLRRALLLTLQLAELGRPMVLVLNMMDELEQRGGRIDTDAPGPRSSGMPVVTTVAPAQPGHPGGDRRAHRRGGRRTVAAAAPGPAPGASYVGGRRGPGRQPPTTSATARAWR